MKLSNLTSFSPLEAMLLKGTGKSYFQKSSMVPPPPSSGFQGGNYGAQMTPRQKEFFGGDFGK